MHRTDRPPLARRVARLVGAVTATVLLFPGVSFAASIDDYAPYQPQTTCSPSAKPGTLRLSGWLQRTYPGSGSLGISRSCKDGGVSEHKEGRAFDWAVDVGSARDRGYVSDFLKRIFATDAEGDTHALARRMGIMYLIWNDRIYSSYYGFRPRPYQGCAAPKGCSATRRHRDHVHISLSRAGGAGTTSWYTGTTTTPPPPGDVLDLTRQPYASVGVKADGSTSVTPFTLHKGTTYKITAAGLFGYGVPAQVADASCRWLGTTRTWAPYPSKAVAAAHGSLNLQMDGAKFADNTCRPTHVYTRTIRPTTTRTLRLRVANIASGASGALTVLVSRPGTDVRAGLPTYPPLSAAPTTSAARSGTGLIAETVRVPGSTGTVRSAGSLEQGADYRITVGGTVALGAGVASDGRCLSVNGAWFPQASLDRRIPAAGHGRLYVDGVPFAGNAPSGRTCAGRTHVLDYTATRTGRLELALWDPLSRSDDTGALTVEVQRVTPVATPAAATTERPASTAPWRQARDTMRVRAAVRSGAVSTMRLRAGQGVDLVARGTDTSAKVAADASCVRTSRGWRLSDSGVALGQDPLQLWVDGQPVSWRPLGGRSGCSAAHAYTARFVATKSGPVRLAVLDLDYRDNAGALTVTLRRA